MITSALMSVASLLLAAAAAVPAPPASAPVIRPGAVQWDVTSRITGRTYRIYVALPAEKGPPPAQGHPVIYLTDGDLMFHTAADALALLSAGLEARPAIIVGIGYGKGLDEAARLRFADLTPTAPAAAAAAAIENHPATKGVTFGDAEGFYRFLTEELRPQIDAAYRTDRSDNSLWGDSLGGLFGLHVLFNHPDSFRTYLVGSPSIIWSDRAILQDESRLAAPVAAGQVAPRILFTVGALEERLPGDAKLSPGVTREQKQAMLTEVAMITSTVALADRIKALPGPRAREIETVIFDGETHFSVLPAAISRGLRFALKP